MTAPIPSPSTTPRQLGYRMPAEWEPHDATWLIWPHKEESWPGRLHLIPPIFAKMAKELSIGEKVRIIVQNVPMEESARELIEAAGANIRNIRFHHIPTNDSWVRDCGPTFIKRSGSYAHVAAIDWIYNAWGEKYGPWDLDDDVPTHIGTDLGLTLFRVPFVLEGGSIDVNGKGLLLTSEACLLNPNRNPTKSREQIEDTLREYLNVETILWLGDGIEGDDTDGHIDDLARFTDERTIVTVVEPNTADPNHPILAENLERLRAIGDQHGLTIETLPMPEPLSFDGQRCPASYANFYIGNECVLVPTFACKADDEALATLRRLFPTRRVVGIDSRDLVWGLGAFHCLTQQQPRA